MMASNTPLKLYGRASDCPARGVVPPSVRPVDAYAGVVGPASLTAASTAVVSPRTSAPRMVFMMLPLWNIMKVGILKRGQFGDLELRARDTHARTPYFWEISCWLSTLTFVNVMRFGLECFFSSCSYAGAI